MIEVVGIGDAGWEALDPSARLLVEKAEFVIGGRRHLEMLPDVAEQERRTWPSPWRDAFAEIVAESHTAPVVLASGDPLLSGVATSLIREFGADKVRVHPAVSSETIARARMGWSAESVDVVTVVGRSRDRFLPLLSPGARLLILCSDGGDPAHIAELATSAGAGGAHMTTWWHLGGSLEGSRQATCDAWGDERTPDLVLVCLEVSHLDADPQRLGPAPGRADAAFDHDGLITKRDVRSAALACLRPLPGQVLWDLGAGSGAVGIEWALAAPRTRTIAVEHDAQRAERIRANAHRFGVSSQLDVVGSSTAEALGNAQLSRPDAIFFGGGIERGLLDDALAVLRPGGRLVAHAVTVETEAALLDAHDVYGGELTRLSVEQLAPLGRFRGWKPARSIVQWSFTVPNPTSDPTQEHA